MSVMQIRCDCCGEIIETGHHKLTLQCELSPAISSRDSATSDPAIVVCKPCFDDLHEWFAESWSSTIIPEALTSSRVASFSLERRNSCNIKEL
ncbi:MAG: hypothetical protein ABSH35_36355 [Isosphaeraceae bacterium]|jgi:hypothetical protein